MLPYKEGGCLTFMISDDWQFVKELPNGGIEAVRIVEVDDVPAIESDQLCIWPPRRHLFELSRIGYATVVAADKQGRALRG